jgi:molybdopterin molybdotransferase
MSVAEGPISLEQARREVLGAVAPLGTEDVELGEALRRTLAEDVAAEAPVQAFDNSAMDGYAVRAADTAPASSAAPAALRIVDESRAGHPAVREVRTGEAIAISTGAMLPNGADAVVRVEDTRRDGAAVLVEARVEAGRDVRRAGEDIAAGETVLRAGRLLGAAELGVLAALGRPSVACPRRPRLALLTSGDELLEPGEAPRPGGVYDSNRATIAALAAHGGAELASAARVAARPEETRAALAAALDGADVLVVCGGVSVGEHDHVKGAFAELGVERRFWGVALKPGRPTYFGSRDDVLVFGLPGNPVSAMVTFTLLVRPALTALAGGDPRRLRTRARLASPYEKQAGRAHAVRCRLELGAEGWVAHPAPRQGSHVLTSMLDADCLAVVPPEVEGIAAGGSVEVELLGQG